MLSPLLRRSVWAYLLAHSPRRISLPRKGRRVGLRIVLFEACSAFTRVTACTLALSPIRDTHSEGFSYVVTSIAAPVASGWSGCRVGLAPTGKRRLVTAHTPSGHSPAHRVAREGIHTVVFTGSLAASNPIGAYRGDGSEETRSPFGFAASHESGNVEWPGGLSPPGSPRTVREPLDSYGSRCSAISMT
jgi:hypothetical protein